MNWCFIIIKVLKEGVNGYFYRGPMPPKTPGYAPIVYTAAGKIFVKIRTRFRLLRLGPYGWLIGSLRLGSDCWLNNSLRLRSDCWLNRYWLTLNRDGLAFYLRKL